MKRWKGLFLECFLFAGLLAGCSASVEKSQNTKAEARGEQVVQVEQTAEEKKEAWIAEKIAEMSVEEKVGQLLMLSYRKNGGSAPLTEMDETIEAMISELRPGGMILFSENIDTEEQTKKLIADFQSVSQIPLFIGVDEEGGRVSRLSASGKLSVTPVPPAAEIAASGDSTEAGRFYREIGNELKQLGFNVDFAPVADINTNPANVVIGDRAFGSDAETAGDFVAEAVRGLHTSGVCSALKHFPGHGDTKTDSHKTETVVSHDKERLEQAELIPFKKGIAAGAEFVMTAHIKTPNVTQDSLPASLSRQMITGILREELGFSKIVITDAMDMGAVTKYYSSGEAAVLAVRAGADIVLMPAEPKEAYEALLEAAESGEISQERLNTSVKRILEVKYDRDILKK